MIVHKQHWHDLTRILVATPFGSVQAEICDKSPIKSYREIAFIYALWVEPSYRRQGEATVLLLAIENELRKSGYKNVRLEWHKKDTPEEILEWYKRKGYKLRESYENGAYYELEKQL